MGEAAEKLPDVPPEQEGAAPHAAAEGSKAPDQGPPSDFIPSDFLVEKYLLDRDKFTKALVAGGFAGGFKLFHNLMMGRLKGKDLLDALRLIEQIWGLPKFSKAELSKAKEHGGWANVLKAKGWDVDTLLKGIEDSPVGDD